MTKLSNNASAQVFQRNSWVTDNGAVQTWVNDLVWRILGGPKAGMNAPQANEMFAEGFEVLRRVLIHNELLGMTQAVYGDKLRDILGPEFYNLIEAARRRTEIFTNEIHWLLGPTLGDCLVAIGDYAARPFYANYGADTANPRFLHALTLWTPTLAVREEATQILEQGGYYKEKRSEEHVFFKDTWGVAHAVVLRGTLWETSKNWSSDIERAMWDRAEAPTTGGGAKKLERTDHFIAAIRLFSVDSLLGSAIRLLDMAMIIEADSQAIDWTRVREVVDAFQKPDWFWTSIRAVAVLENRAGRSLDMPKWVRDGLKELENSFWPAFLDTRLNWANPDTKLGEFSRASVKLSKGT